MAPGVILYGPPASGKDTITTELLALDPHYVAYQRLKVGGGKSHGYRVIATERLRELESRGAVLYSNSRYGNVYAVDRESVAALIQAGRIPVLHLGQVQGITAVEAFPARWVRVLLWCARATTAERVAGRGDSDIGDRLRAWDETRRDLREHANIQFDAIIRTDEVAASTAARMIHAAVAGSSDPHPADDVLEVDA
ncbi:guanylate kinase [Planosporangium mesophilum]|uniref:Guanylate kinase/L-type calcium channel beta subunit domain-containing protein n=1 Tax=Planosporangium mesophilum TaxID=689768 RepID=A0A8J3THF4_9ACTN|nr:guanylate kinase [Planosporangium mesophilum]NJC86811.1 guanylate kinase [Planosporangium mesophilum]GII26518.1 hypothetical protein Pme01_61150 [Planosporangium mesophilum]